VSRSLDPAGSPEAPPRFYTTAGLHTETYDAAASEVPGGDDVSFFRRLAEKAGGPVLELGCGTGRVAIPLAEAGVTVVGLDRSPDMLAIAEGKRTALSPAVRRRVRFVEADMTDFRVGRRFGLVFAAFRVFMHLLDPDAQLACLAAVRRHLRPGGLLVIDVFDPKLGWLEPGGPGPKDDVEVVHPGTGRRVRRMAVARTVVPVSQRLTIRMRFTESDDAGGVVRDEVEDLVMRWTYRFELWHLLERSGFERVAEYSDYAGSPPRYAGEIIAVARRPAVLPARRRSAGRASA
jgi:SAM-dependent methyltransferase